MASSSSFRISSLVGQPVWFSPHGEPHHGVITRATWSTLGEPVLIIHPDDHPADLSADTVLIGPPAAEVIAAATARDAA